DEHLTPEAVGRIAARAGVKMVVLTHVGPGADDETDMRHYTQGVRNMFDGPVVIARDGDEF
ncbi:MAG: MBL fold metallo-hydrolase, partial [Novosphingobium sp.]